MATKLQLYTDMAKHAATWIIGSHERWTGFLDTASRLYKYSFAEQLMIFAQRPDATACATLKTWNAPMNCRIRRGSKGIALIDAVDEKLQLRYVFDVKDTEEDRGFEQNHPPRRPYLWRLTPDNMSIVIDDLSQTHGEFTETLSTVLYKTAGQLATEYYLNNVYDINNCITGSFLNDFNESAREAVFIEAATVSAAHSLMSRCGIDPKTYFDDEDYQSVFDFNTANSIHALGTAVSEISEQILRQIEITIKNYERKKARESEHEQSDIHQGGRLHDTGLETAAPDGDDAREIRTLAPDILENSSENPIQLNDTARDAISASAGDRQDGGVAAGTVNTAAYGITKGNGVTESRESDEMGWSNEQHPSPSGRSDTERTDIRLVGSVFPQEAVNAILRDGSNLKNSSLRIVAHYMKGKTLSENADFLKQEYKIGGKGFQFGTQKIAIWFDEAGMKFGDGTLALHDTTHSIHLSWDQIAIRVHELLEIGQFIPQEELDKALENERKELAEKLWHLHSNSANGISLDEDIFKGGFPESTASIARMLSAPSHLDTIISGLDSFCAVYEHDRSALRFHYINPYELLGRFTDLRREHIVFRADEVQTWGHIPFITDDEVDTQLMRGSSIQEGKFRIFSFFLHEHSNKEKADFLKNEYGWGGGSWHGVDGGWTEAQPSKGITLKRQGCEKVSLTWNKAARMINELINTGRYMRSDELDRISAYEEIMLARQINNFYHNLTEEYQPPFDKSLDFYYPREKEWASLRSFLDDTEKIDAVLNVMKSIYEDTLKDDRHYNLRKIGFDNLSAYREGTYTLFPNLTPNMLPENVILTSDVIEIPGEQLSIFSTENNQQEIIVQSIEQAEEKEPSAFSMPIIKQGDIDAALCEWNSNIDSKILVYQYMQEHGRKRDTANVLKNEYAEYKDGIDIFTVTKDGVEPITMPWSKVQRRIAELIKAEQFLTHAELDYFYKDYDNVKDSEAGLNETEQIHRTYAEGDIIYLEEDKPYTIIKIDYDITLHEIQEDSESIPICRSESFYRFERLLRQNLKNKAITDFLSAHLAEVHPVLGEVLTDSLLTQEMKNYVSTLIANGFNNLEIAETFLNDFRDINANYTLANGTKLTYKWHQSGLIIDVEDGYSTRLARTWEEIASICRSQYMQGIDGYRVIQKTSEPERTAHETMVHVAEDTEGKASMPPTGAGKPERPQAQTETSPEISQTDIDHAVKNWNGNIDSKIRVYEYMYANARARNTSTFLRQEYGSSAFTFFSGSENRTLPWSKVQRRIAQLIDVGQFLTTEEQVKADERLDSDWEQLVSKDTDQNALIQHQHASHPSRPNPEQAIKPSKPEAEQEPDDGGLLAASDIAYIQDELQHLDITTQDEAPVTIAKPINFRITDDHLGEGGLKTKYGYNISAIQTLKQVEVENRHATPEEQEVLSRYVGWGGLPNVFDETKEGWEKEYIELQSLLTPGEYEMARASTLNAHYTSPTVVKAIYNAVERLGFKTGNVLEPSCGIGSFFGLLPESMKTAKLYGVELDSITGRIARQLYPDANITMSGFEKTNIPDNFFDIAIGNVPFGVDKVLDKRYEKNNFLIHDYFLAKSLDKVRPGGIITFITSKGTMDKQNPEVRKYIAQRAELLGAVRLPNIAFLKNAGTKVTSDILFFQKRDRLIDIQPDWVHLAQTDDGIPINSYFAQHPEMVLGTMTFDNRMYGDKKETTCNPYPNSNLADQLHDALSHIKGQITENELDDIEGIEDNSIPAVPSVRNFSYTLVDGKVYYRENSQMNLVDVSDAALERIKGMIALRDCTHELIDYQLNDYDEIDIKTKQTELNTLYDSYTRKYGLINGRANNQAFSADSAYYLLCSLEMLDENGDLERKADMFTTRTIKKKTIAKSVDTASEALAVSIAERACVDLTYMVQLLDGNKKIFDIVNDLQGVIFKDPATGPLNFDSRWNEGWQTADEYLSGNVREKLKVAREAAEKWPEFAINVSALEKAQPKELNASEIAVRLGSTWIDKKYIAQFMVELLQPPHYLKNILKVNYSEHTGEWGIEGTGRIPSNNIQACVTYGTQRVNAYEIIRDTLNLKDVRVYDYKKVDGEEKLKLDKEETTIAQQKQKQIKEAFIDWIFRDPDRRQELVRLYNERFNSTRQREYNGKHINFSGINPEIELKEHQVNAIARILYGGNTMLAHVVGAGKTFEMVAAAMESKRLGLCQKSLFVVPNHLTEQWASEFLHLYPAANILVARAKDFETKNRKKFCAKISTGDYDAVIIGHSQLEKIPMSMERRERLIREQIYEIATGIRELKAARAERFAIKQLERTKRSLESRLAKLTDESRKDSVVSFEQLGIDRLFVDEAHMYKNLFLYTKMRNVAGLSTSEAQKSSDLFMKCRYLDELTGNKGVIFATGTPVSNSMTEIYTMQRYLQHDALVQSRLTHFDSWASTFGETVTLNELAPEGTVYKPRTRFAQFYNLPEVIRYRGSLKELY